MAHRETELDRITTLLGQCLGRIDEQAFRLQRGDDEPDWVGDVLEQEAATLQELVSTLVAAHASTDRADLNRVVDHAVRDSVAEAKAPVAVRQRLAPALPEVACSPGQLGFAVQRALLLAFGRADAGSDVVVTTRREGESVLFELECSGHRRDRHLRERAATLCEFVAGLQGNCQIDGDEQGHLLLAIELPAATVADER